jgi:hypothetical protein
MYIGVGRADPDVSIEINGPIMDLLQKNNREQSEREEATNDTDKHE